MDTIIQSAKVKTVLQQENDKLVIRHLQDTNNIMEFNYEARKRSNDIWSKGDKEIKFIGRIPGLVYDDWEKMGITHDDKAFTRALEIEQNGRFKGTNKRV